MIGKNFIIISLMVVFTALLSGCLGVNFGGNIGAGGVRGTGAIESRDMALGNFDSIIIDGSYNVIYRYSSASSLTVVMHENLFEYFEVSVENGVLEIGSTRSFNVNRGQAPRLYVYAPSLRSIDIRGAVDTIGWDTIYGENFYITVGGAADIDIHVEVERLSISSAGAADINLRGNAHDTGINMAGAGNLAARDLQTRDASIIVAGAADVEIAVSDTLDVVITGAGSVQYFGNPVVTQQITGVGRVRSGN